MNHFWYNQKSGHPEKHKCKHFHKCQGEYSNKGLRECKIQCKLEYNHESPCNCKSSHLCNKYCIYYKSSKNCKGKCNLELNHQGDCKCENETHKRDCRYKGKSLGCINDGKCDFNLPHDNHKCIQICSLSGLYKGMLCLYNCGHKGDNEDHLYNEFHKCIEICELNGKDNNVKKNAVYHMGIKKNIIIINKLIIILTIFIKKNQWIVLKIKQ